MVRLYGEIIYRAYVSPTQGFIETPYRRPPKFFKN